MIEVVDRWYPAQRRAVNPAHIEVLQILDMRDYPADGTVARILVNRDWAFEYTDYDAAERWYRILLNGQQYEAALAEALADRKALASRA